jgi:hypothetical protein
MADLKSFIKPMVPRKLLKAYQNFNVARSHSRVQGMTTAEVFADIYSNNRWGGEPGTFCSGSGSSTSSIVDPYVSCIRRALSELGAQDLTVVDLGCGDFSVGRQLDDACGRYIGVDIVANLIRHNDLTFGTDRVAFQCLDIIEDPLPQGEVCFVRQVMQHLSNHQISRILPKLEQYRWTFITEHQPSPSCLKQHNLDKPHGSDIRVHRGSGVYLDYSPFNIPRERLELLLEVPGHSADKAQDPGMIRTFLLRR